LNILIKLKGYVSLVDKEYALNAVPYENTWATEGYASAMTVKIYRVHILTMKP
jgi:hypothetical protein